MPPRRMTVQEYQASGESASRPVGVDQSAPQTEAQAPQLEVATQDVRELADSIIGKTLVDLADAKIVYAFEGRDHKKGGRVQFGRIQILGAVERWLGSGRETVEGGPDLVVLVSRSQWLATTEPRTREARFAQLLAQVHPEVNEDDGATHWRRRHPDAEVYLDIVQAYGWGFDSGLQQARTVAVQMSMPMEVAR